MSSPSDLALDAPSELLPAADSHRGDATELRVRVEAECREAFATSTLLTGLLAHPAAAAGPTDPETRLANQLKTISALLKSGSAASVFYTAQSGYDTHANQLDGTANCYRNCREHQGVSRRPGGQRSGRSGAGAGLQRVWPPRRRECLAGNRPRRRGPRFLAGSLAAGIYGPPPNLADLRDGDVPVAIDFRQVYATILDQWLNVRAADVLSTNFDQLTLLKT